MFEKMSPKSDHHLGLFPRRVFTKCKFGNSKQRSQQKRKKNLSTCCKQCYHTREEVRSTITSRFIKGTHTRNERERVCSWSHGKLPRPQLPPGQKEQLARLNSLHLCFCDTKSASNCVRTRTLLGSRTQQCF